MPSDQEREYAEKVAREWLELWGHENCELTSDLAALLLREREAAVERTTEVHKCEMQAWRDQVALLVSKVKELEAARPEIERKAKVGALKWVKDNCDLRERIDEEMLRSELTRLRAEGGSDATTR